MKLRAPLIALAIQLSTAVASVSVEISGNVPVTVPTAQPAFAKRVDASLAAFSLEFQYWPVYAGNATNQPNQYMNQLLQNLAERTGKTPALRVGGTSENTAYVDTSFQVWNASQLDEVYGPFNKRANTSIGRDWYVLAGNLPVGTEFTFGLNLYDHSQVSAQAQMLADAFQGSRRNFTENVVLKFVQVGNEPNFYFPFAASYVSHWNSLAQVVMKNLEMGGESHPTFWIGSEVIEYPGSFQLTGTLEAGILDDNSIANANYVLEEHLYSGAMNTGAIPGGPAPGTLMDKLSIRGNLSSVYKGLLNTESYKRMYYLGETSTYAAEGIFGLSNTGESAVWTVDYMLQAASMGVNRVYLHSTPNRMFSVFQPGWNFPNGTGIERPHIMPMYNGLLVVNEMIGQSGDVMIAEIENTNKNLATYGVWKNNKLTRMALINSNVVSENSTMRSALNVTLSGGWIGGAATVKRLSIPYTTATEGITWAGQSFETDSGVPSGDIVEVPLVGTSVTVAASEVVLLSFK